MPPKRSSVTSVQVDGREYGVVLEDGVPVAIYCNYSRWRGARRLAYVQKPLGRGPTWDLVVARLYDRTAR